MGSQVAVVTNLLLVFFVLPFGDDIFPEDGYLDKTSMFILTEHAMFAFKIIMAAIIPDHSEALAISEQRREYLEHILIDKAVEDIDEYAIANHEHESQKDYTLELRDENDKYKAGKIMRRNTTDPTLEGRLRDGTRIRLTADQWA